MKEIESLLGDRENLVRVQVLRQRLAAENTKRNAVVLVAYDVVRAGRDRGEIGGQLRRGRELPATPERRTLIAKRS